MWQVRSKLDAHKEAAAAATLQAHRARAATIIQAHLRGTIVRLAEIRAEEAVRLNLAPLDDAIAEMEAAGRESAHRIHSLQSHVDELTVSHEDAAKEAAVAGSKETRPWARQSRTMSGTLLARKSRTISRDGRSTLAAKNGTMTSWGGLAGTQF